MRRESERMERREVDEKRRRGEEEEEEEEKDGDCLAGRSSASVSVLPAVRLEVAAFGGVHHYR